MHNGQDKCLASPQDGRVAKVYYSDRDVQLTAEAKRSRLKLQEMYNTQKSLGRSRANHRKQIEERFTEGTNFLEEDFRRSFKIVQKDLDIFISSFQSTASSQGTKEAGARLNFQKIMRKLSMSPLFMLIFSATGQRQQVYTTLQCPDENELIDMRNKLEGCISSKCGPPSKSRKGRPSICTRP